MHKIVLTSLIFLCVMFASAQTEFITTWKTDNPGISENNQITIPTFPGETYNYSVDWGDGNINNNVTGNITHTYGIPGTYQVSIEGTFPRIYFNESGDREKILNVKQWGAIKWSSMESAFARCSNLSVAAIDTPDLSNATSLRRMFFYCYYAFDFSGNREYTNFNGVENFNDWDVSTVTDMSNMFDKSAFNQDISAWVVSNVTDMSYLFFSSRFNQEIGNWDVSKVQNMEGIFGSSLFRGDVTGWDVSSVLNMAFMFNSTYFDQDISSWDVGNVTNMRHMLSQCSFNQDISNWNIGSVRDLSNIFDDNDLSRENYDKILMGWSQLPSLQFGTNLGAKDVQYCLSGDARQILINTYNWSIIDQGQNCEEERAFITTWKTDNPGPSEDNQITIPTNPREVYSYNVDWGDDTSDAGVTEDIIHTYSEPGIYQVSITGRFPHIYFNNGSEPYPVQSPRKASDTDKIISVDQWGTIRWNSMSFAFAGCENLDVLATDIPDFSKDIHLSYMFYGCSSLKGNESMSQWDLSDMTFTASSMFSEAVLFNQPIDQWDVSRIRYLDGMFRNAASFNQNLEEWDIGKAENMDAMFDGSGISVSNYDSILNAWSNLPNLLDNVKLGAINTNYCNSEDARQKLISINGWIINDSGKAPFCNEDNDADGILDHLDSCLNTTGGAVVDARGCEIIPADVVSIYSQTPTCVNESNGSIEISSKFADYTFTVSIAGAAVDAEYTGVSLDEVLKIENLSAGLYTLTVGIPDALYEQTFGVTVNQVNSVTGKRQSIDPENKTAIYVVSGGLQYKADVNGKTELFTFDSTAPRELQLTGLSDYNSISISGKNDCQGKVEDTFNVAGEVFVYPIMTKDVIFVHGIQSKANVQVYDMAGRIVLEKVLDSNENISLNLEGCLSGMYPIKVTEQGNTKSFKVIKQ